MNHPERDEWGPYLFGETTPEISLRLDAHLANCPECRLEIESWKRSLRRLDAWKLTPVTQPMAGRVPLLRWAVATMLVLAIGFAVGRLSTTRANAATLQAMIEPALRQQQ